MKRFFTIVILFIFWTCTPSRPDSKISLGIMLGLISEIQSNSLTGESINFLTMPLARDNAPSSGQGKLERIFREANLGYILDNPDLKTSFMVAYKSNSQNPWKLYHYNAEYVDANGNGRPDPTDLAYHFPASTSKTFNTIIALERAKALDYAITDSLQIKDHRGDDNPINNFTTPNSQSKAYTGEGLSFADYDESGSVVYSSQFMEVNATPPVAFGYGGGDVYSTSKNLNCFYDDFSYPGPYDGINGTYSVTGSLAQLMLMTHAVSNNHAAGYTIGISGWENTNERFKAMGFLNVRLNRYYGALALSNFSQGCSADPIDLALLTVKGTKTLYNLGAYRQVFSPPYEVVRAGKPNLHVRAIYPTRPWYPSDSWDATEANNFATARDFMELWRRIVDFDLLPESQKFQVRSDDMGYLRYVSSKTPKELGVRYANGSDYYDDFCKFFMKGLDRVYGRGKYIMYNKCGTAMGQFSDTGYILKTHPTDARKDKRFVVYWNTYSSSINRLNLNFDQGKISEYYDIGSYLMEAIVNAAENEKL